MLYDFVSSVEHKRWFIYLLITFLCIFMHVFIFPSKLLTAAKGIENKKID